MPAVSPSRLLPRLIAGAFALLALVQAGQSLGAEGLVRFRDWHVHLCWQQGFFDALVAGEPWPRWITQANQGFGGPVFLYYPPLAYFLGSALLGAGASAALALKTLYAASLLAGALGVFFWLRHRVSDAQAVALAALWCVLPAGSQFALHFNMPASALALALLPWIALRLERPRDGAVDPWLVLLLAALLYTHVLSAFLLAICLALCVALLGWRGGGKGRRQAGRIALSGLLATALAAPFWLPLLLALDAVHLEHLRSAAPWRVVDNLLGAGGQLPSLAEASSGLLLLGALVFATLRAPRDHPARWIYLLCGVLGFVLASALATPLYQALPALQFLQFPWRWDGLVALCALRLMAAALLDPPAAGRPAAIGWTALVLSLALAWHSAAPLRAAAAQRVPADEAALHAQRCVWPNLEYRPRAMGEAWRLDLQTWPRHARLVEGSGRISALDASLRRYRVALDSAATVQFPQLAFEGWRARMEPMQTAPADAQSLDGRLMLRLPAGRYTLTLERETPAGQSMGVVLALTAAALLVLCVARGQIRRRAGSPPAAGAGP